MMLLSACLASSSVFGPPPEVVADQDHEIGLLAVEYPIHELDRATVGAVIVLHVVGLNDLEGAVGVEARVLHTSRPSIGYRLTTVEDHP
jgi:hypothetical protein